MAESPRIQQARRGTPVGQQSGGIRVGELSGGVIPVGQTGRPKQPSKAQKIQLGELKKTTQQQSELLQSIPVGVISGAGIVVGSQGGKTILRLKNWGPKIKPALTKHPFEVKLSRRNSTYTYTVKAGTHNGNIPTVLDDESATQTSLAERPAPIALFGGSSDGTGKVWLHVTASITATNDFVTGVEETAWVIESGTDVPDDDEVAGEYYILLATFVDGVKTTQAWKTSLSAYYIDTLYGDGSAQIKVNGITS